MDIKPLADIVIVKMAKIEAQVRGKLVLPEVDAERQEVRWGEVVGVGPGSFSQARGDRIPIDVKVGDLVGINGHAPAIRVTEDEIDYLMVNAPSIVCFSQSTRDTFFESSRQE